MNSCTPLRTRLERQGYIGYTDEDLRKYQFGIRFAYVICTSIVALGLVFTSTKVLLVAMVVALFGTLPPYHPFDYLYNYVLRHAMNLPKIPPRTNQGRFACGIASVWLAATIYLFYIDQVLWGNILGLSLLSVAFLVSSTHICIPSMVYNFLFKKQKPVL